MPIAGSYLLDELLFAISRGGRSGIGTISFPNSRAIADDGLNPVERPVFHRIDDGWKVLQLVQKAQSMATGTIF